MNKITDITVIEQLPGIFSSDDMVSIDIEGFGMDKKRLHRPTGRFASIALTADGINVYVLTDVNMLKVLERCLFENSPTLVFHNAMFDVVQLRRWMNFPATEKIYDTMLLEKILYSGMFDRFSLKDLARRHLNVYMDKEARDSYEKAKENTNEMLRYNAIDAAVTWRVCKKQLTKMTDKDKRVWQEIDMPVMWALMDFKGPKINEEGWREFAKGNSERSAEWKKEFPFNPASAQQIKKYFNAIGVKLENTNAKYIDEVQDKHPMLKQISLWRKLDKLRSTYGEKWADTWIEDDGRVHPSWKVIQAITGRTQTDSPSIHNMPTRDTPEIRKQFVAAEGCKLVGADYSSQEPRIAAFKTRDSRLIEIIISGGDIYAKAAALRYKREIKKTDVERANYKAIVLGLDYGLTKYGLSRNLKISKDEAQELLDGFFEVFTGIKLYVETARNNANNPKHVCCYTILGRRVWLNKWNMSSANLDMNAPIQGSASDMIKIATSSMWKAWGKPIEGFEYTPEPFPCVLQVHDELIAEVLEANVLYTSFLLKKCMVDAAEYITPGVPAVVDVKVGNNWSEIH